MTTRPSAEDYLLPDDDRGPDSGPSEAKNWARKAYGQLVMGFEPNRGQTDPRVRFLARGIGYNVFLTATETVLSLRQSAGRADASTPSSHGSPLGPTSGVPSTGAVLAIRMVDANAGAEATGRRPVH